MTGAAALTVCLLAVHSCGGDAPGSPSAFEHPAVRVTTAHFRVLADRADSTLLGSIADALESNYQRIMSDLHVTDLPVVSVWVWQDSASFYADMQSRGLLSAGATGYVLGANALSILARPQSVRSAVHEFAHVVSIGVNPRIPNNPRWLWETVALYENREFIDPSTIEYMRAGRYPSLADLDAPYSAGRQVYDVGYVLGEFIVETWGLDGLVRLVQANGDVRATFGVTTEQFESAWHLFLNRKYALPLP